MKCEGGNQQPLGEGRAVSGEGRLQLKGNAGSESGLVTSEM